jgi:hypothetical protein
LPELARLPAYSVCVREETIKTSVPILKDFWLLDDERCFLMEYDFLGRFLGRRFMIQPKFTTIKVQKNGNDICNFGSIT